MTVDEIKLSFGPIMGEFDSLYYPKDGRSISGRLSLLSTSSKNEMLELSLEMNGVIMLVVNHVQMPRIDEDEDELDSDKSYSDEEFTEIRRATRADRKRIEQEEMLHDMFEEDEGDEEYFSEDSSGSEYFNPINSEEDEDDEVCYAEPPPKRKVGNIEEIFNSATPAKEIKWRVGLIL
ncbi:hypothetical protein POM88_000812 [Heracleum sosnowskyi]|uniref:Uncharacterized protein n=1 Tax=Heracleum sosnowskyi TaxID=360622 RepID=A0AAD8N9S2_9APIA|nr:hypothetical protein POM88_000812 [Heracleum sosnowskyi]